MVSQMDRKIKLLIQNCFPCQAATLNDCQEPLKMTKLPSGTWEHVAVGFKGPLLLGYYLPIVFDDHSRFVKLKSLNQPQRNQQYLNYIKNFLPLVYLWKLKVTMIHLSIVPILIKICKIFRGHSSAHYTWISSSKWFSWKL